MFRFAFTFFLLLLLVGCRTTAHTPQKTVIVQNQHAAQQFWNRTAQLIQPLMPDTGKNSTEVSTPLTNSRPQNDILPVNHTAHSLYKPGSIFLSPRLALHDTQSYDGGSANSGSANVLSPLQIQTGDSEAFQSLLREIAIVPAEKWNVDKEKLSELLTSFRNEIMDSDVEDEYLALLRRRILPERTAPRTTAPMPELELAEPQRMTPNRQRQINRQIDWATDDDYDYEPVVAQRPMRTPDYPSLVQLPAAASGVAQVAYQNQVSPAMSGYGAGDWQTPARLAVEQLRYAIEQTPNGRSVSNEMRLRLLETMLGNKTEAARPMQSADETTNSFMQNQVLGFAALLDDTAQPSRNKHVAAAFHFNDGLVNLQEICPIRLKNVTFVRDWFGYGQFVPHSKEYYPGDRFRVYVEIENPTLTRGEMFETCVSISYEIRDDRANVIAKQEGASPFVERTLSRKRDYCLEVTGVIPSSAPPGQYKLVINITDLNDKSTQFAVESLDFRVVPSTGE